MISAIFRSECHLPPTNRETFVQNYDEHFSRQYVSGGLIFSRLFIGIWIAAIRTTDLYKSNLRKAATNICLSFPSSVNTSSPHARRGRSIWEWLSIVFIGNR